MNALKIRFRLLICGLVVTEIVLGGNTLNPDYNVRVPGSEIIVVRFCY